MVKSTLHIYFRVVGNNVYILVELGEFSLRNRI